MHIVISCVGSAGDVHPFLAIGRALAQRGHEVEVMTAPPFRPRVEAAGLACVPFGDAADFDRVVADPDLWHPRRAFTALWREMARQLGPACDVLAGRLRPGRTVLVGSTLAWHVRLVQEAYGVPAATVHLAPACIFSATDPAALPGVGDLSGWPAWSVRALHALIERAVVDPRVGPGLDGLRAGLGLPPVRRIVSRWIHSPQLVVCAWPDWFAPRQRDWPAAAVTTGFPHWPAAAGEAADDALERFLGAGPPPIAFTPGSAMAHGRRFFARAVAAAAALDRRALLVSPYADQLPQPLPRGAHAVAYAPFDRLLPRVAALVHHGGIGTSAAALAAGVPQLVTPFAHDQFDNAVRLVRLGVARRLAPRQPARRWAAALAELTASAEVAAAVARGAERLRASDPAATRIAALIERLDPARGAALPPDAALAARASPSG